MRLSRACSWVGRVVVCSLLFAAPLAAGAQGAAALAADAPLTQALSGRWVGVLEYRDYSEPPASTKRVDLPTWLAITAQGSSMTWTYVYDDGPNKVIDETDMVSFDTASRTYSESANGKPATRYAVDGFDTLKDGRGTLVLHGSGTDNNKPSETRVTMTIRRNLLQVLEEVRPAGSSEPFVFRHLFRFTREQPPAVTTARR